MTAGIQDSDKPGIVWEFSQAVNMTPKELERWLESDHSKEVGWHHEGEAEAVGHQSGRAIVELRHKKKADLTDEDYRQMRRVIGYVHRHLAQRPSGDVTDTRWRYSLMNWGHDPLKDKG